MAQYSLSVNINTSDFPELGNPVYPDKNIAKKVPRNLKEDYKGYMQSCDIGMSDALYRVRQASQSGSNISCEADVSSVKMNFPYEKETGKTYKFLGMDIDEDFDSIVKIGEGHVIVGSMFDRNKMESLIERTNIGRYGIDKDWAEKSLKRLNQNVEESIIRKIATSIKAGSAYSMIKEWDRTSVESDYEEFYKSFIDTIKRDIQGEGDSIRTGTSLFSSIILNLVNMEELEKEDIKGSSFGADDADKEKILIEVYLAILFNYWTELSKTYSGVVTQLSALDIWSDLNKKIVGDAEFNRRFSKCIDITDNTTGEIVQNITSFAGVSRNGGVIDQNIIRDQGASSLESFANTMLEGDITYDKPGNHMRHVLLSMVDDSDIEDVYSLTDEEAQALSALDSLRYIDEEAAMSRASYDMNDPDERGLFVKSAIRSYERNFREFKPARNYDVTEALAELVERGDIESNKVVSQEVLATKSESEVGDIVTLSGESIRTQADVNSLKRVMKMINKFSKDILSSI